MSDEITITRKYVIYPIASDMKEWERKVIKYVSENYEKRIQLLEQKIKHSKIPKEEKENLRKELDNLKIKYDAFQADPAITQSEINTYTYGTVRTAMEEEATKKNYILSWIYSEMIGAGVQHMETLKEKYQFISNRMNYAYRLPGNKNGSLFDEAEIHNILKGYGFAFSQMLTSKIKDCVKKGLLEGKVSLPNYKIDSPFTVAKACMGFSHDYDNFEELCEHIHDSDLKLYFDYGGNKKPSIAKFKIDLGKGKNREELAATLLKVYSGEYEYCGSSIQISKKKIILNLSMKIPKIPTELECSSGGRTKYNRNALGYPKEHHYDALCVGKIPEDGFVDWTHGYYLYAKATGRGTRLRGQLNGCGVIISKWKNRSKTAFGFQTGDLVVANVPKDTKYKYKGRFVGRVMIRKSGSFDIRTLSGELVTVNAKFCRLLQNNSGYQMMIKRAIPLGD